MDSNGLEQVYAAELADLGLESCSIIGAGTEAAVLMERDTEETLTVADMYVYLAETDKLILCDTLEEAPGYITFTDDGFYALWKHQLIFYDYEGDQEVICEGTGTYYTQLDEE